MLPDKEFVLETLKVWRTYSKDQGLNTNDALDIIANVSAFFDQLHKWEREAESDKEM